MDGEWRRQEYGWLKIYSWHRDGTMALWYEPEIGQGGPGKIHDYNDSAPVESEEDSDQQATGWFAAMEKGNTTDEEEN
jgi:hypothetical protein